MKLSFTKAQVAKALKVGFGKLSGVSICFGDHSRFCARLEVSRFGSLVLFIEDAMQRDEDFKTLNRIVWQSEPERLEEGAAFVMAKYPEAETAVV